MSDRTAALAVQVIVVISALAMHFLHVHFVHDMGVYHLGVAFALLAALFQRDAVFVVRHLRAQRRRVGAP